MIVEIRHNRYEARGWGRGANDLTSLPASPSAPGGPISPGQPGSPALPGMPWRPPPPGCPWNEKPSILVIQVNRSESRRIPHPKITSIGVHGTYNLKRDKGDLSLILIGSQPSPIGVQTQGCRVSSVLESAVTAQNDEFKPVLIARIHAC